MIQAFYLSNIISYFGIFSSIMALFFTMTNQISLAMLAFIITGICDLFDGIFARKFKRSDLEKQMGVQVDSLADMINFVCVPVLLVLSISPSKLIAITIATIYVLAALSRLAYFNVSMLEVDTSQSISHFTGLPVTYAALVIPLLFVITNILNPPMFSIVLNISMFTLSFLFILKIQIPKPRGKAYLFFVLLAIGVIYFLINNQF